MRRGHSLAHALRDGASLLLGVCDVVNGIALVKGTRNKLLGEVATKPAKKRATKETKVKTSVGITVSPKARKNLRPEEMTTALQETLEQFAQLGEAAKAAIDPA